MWQGLPVVGAEVMLTAAAMTDGSTTQTCVCVRAGGGPWRGEEGGDVVTRGRDHYMTSHTAVRPPVTHFRGR